MPKSRPQKSPKVPAYRQRSGYDQAIVTLTDAVTKRRRGYWLGMYGTPASRERYHRPIAALEAGGCATEYSVPRRPVGPSDDKTHAAWTARLMPKQKELLNA